MAPAQDGGPVPDLNSAREALIRSMSEDVPDEHVLEAFRKVPRERFIDAELRPFAYHDRPLPIGHGQTISQPRIVAMMLRELDLNGSERVLDVGSGSGYQAALLAQLAAEVIGVELIPELTERSRAVIRELGYDNVHIELAGDELGFPEGAPYDAIVVGAASPRVPQSLTAQLAPGGRLVIPVGSRDGQDLLVVKKGTEGLTVTRKGSCRFVPLIGREAYGSAANEDFDGI
jgi:protein-L-isoaspartate(D-aspartate) O-methyltransferase